MKSGMKLKDRRDLCVQKPQSTERAAAPHAIIAWGQESVCVPQGELGAGDDGNRPLTPHAYVPLYC